MPRKTPSFRKMKSSQVNILELFGTQVDDKFSKTIGQLSNVAKYTSKITPEKYKGYVFLQPNWRVYEFHISQQRYKQCLSVMENPQTCIERLFLEEVTNISMFSQSTKRDPLNTLPFFSYQHVNWQPVSHSDTAILLKTFRYFIGNVEQKSDPRFFTTPLSFYPNGRLIAFHSSQLEPEHKWLYFLEANPENNTIQYYTLNGLSAPIHDCNSVLSIQLTEYNVIDYFCFFSFFIQSEGSSFYILNSQNDVSLPLFMWDSQFIHNNERLDLLSIYRPPKLLESNGGYFLIEATMYHGNSLSIVEAEILTNGNVILKKSKNISETLPYWLEIDLS